MLAEMRHAIHGSKSLVPLFDVLWNNDPERNEQFNPQVVNITDFNLSDYNLFIVEIVGCTKNRDQILMARNGVSSYVEESITNIMVSPNVIQFDSEGIFFATRTVSINRSNNTIVFGAGEKFIYDNMGNPIEDNQSAVPVCVLGTKI